MPAEETKTQNQELNLTPVLSEVTNTVSGTAKTFKDMGLDVALKTEVDLVEFATDNQAFIRRDRGLAASSANIPLVAGVHQMGREEALQSSFIDAGAPVVFKIKAFKYTQL